MGARAPAVLGPVTGRLRVARFVLGLVRQAQRRGVRMDPVLVNGQPGARVFDEQDALIAVLCLHIADGHIRRLYNVMNPDKLRHLAGRTGGPGFSRI